MITREVYGFTLRESPVSYGSRRITGPLEIDQFIHDHAIGSPRFTPDVEQLLVIALTTKNQIIGFHWSQSGTVNSCVVHPRNVFRWAILENAVSIAIAHNHPSGDPEPSRADIETTRSLIQAGQLLKIDVVDHVIFTQTPGNYRSLRLQGYFIT